MIMRRQMGQPSPDASTAVNRCRLLATNTPAASYVFWVPFYVIDPLSVFTLEPYSTVILPFIIPFYICFTVIIS